jgi:predicted TIM-barrel fold metal-dependent hydrolase
MQNELNAARERIAELERVLNLGFRMSGKAGCAKRTNRKEFLAALFEEIEYFQEHAKRVMGDKLNCAGMMKREWR